LFKKCNLLLFEPPHISSFWHKPVSFLSRYVDSYRGISVQLGGPEADLKNEIDKSGLANFSSEAVPGAPTESMYLKQAEHLMKKGVTNAALGYLQQALTMNPESKVRFCDLNYSSSIQSFYF